MMTTCTVCGAMLEQDSPAGLCPRCLLSQAVGGCAETSAGPGDTSALPPDGSAAGHAIDVTDISEIAKRLPQFEVIELLGKGGMGVVYKARQIQLDRIVALKILLPADAVSPGFIERFRREARSLAKLNHPHIVTVHDFGESNGLYYLIMEFVDGVNLRHMIEGKRMTAAEALTVIPAMCDALQYAHEEGVVHRDIKPENILVDQRGRVKIADFGLAKLLGRAESDPRLTATGASLGTPRYMAPEQFDKPDSVDHRADIYSLGVVFYEMLTGELPIGRFAVPSQKVQIDIRLDEIVLHALERDVSLRYQQVSEVRVDVENVTHGPPPADPLQMSEKVPRARASWLGRRSSRFRTILPFAIFLVGAVLLLVASIPTANDVGSTAGMCFGKPSPWLEVSTLLQHGIMAGHTFHLHPRDVFGGASHKLARFHSYEAHGAGIEERFEYLSHNSYLAAVAFAIVLPVFVVLVITLKRAAIRTAVQRGMPVSAEGLTQPGSANAAWRSGSFQLQPSRDGIRFWIIGGSAALFAFPLFLPAAYMGVNDPGLHVEGHSMTGLDVFRTSLSVNLTSWAANPVLWAAWILLAVRWRWTATLVGATAFGLAVVHLRIFQPHSSIHLLSGYYCWLASSGGFVPAALGLAIQNRRTAGSRLK